MPRIRAGALAAGRDGVRLPGVYEDLLRREREHVRDSRTVWADPNDRAAGVFCRSTGLLDALEAGEPVTVAPWQLSGGHERRVRLPAFLRSGEWPDAWFRVSSDDVVELTDSPVVDRPRPVLTVAQDEEEVGD